MIPVESSPVVFRRGIVTSQLTPCSSLYWNDHSYSTGQKNASHLVNASVHCRVNESLPPVHILRQINPVRTLPFHSFKVNFVIILPFMPLCTEWVCLAFECQCHFTTTAYFTFIHLPPTLYNRSISQVIFVVTPCVLLSYSIILPTTAHIQNLYNLHIKTLKTLRHVSVLAPSSGSHIVLAKVTL